jgi:methylated-DNA-[protein]-cysteine S-methyltransferase
MLNRTDLDTPVGPISLVTRDDVLCALVFADRWDSIERTLKTRFGSAETRTARGGEAAARLRAYLGGELEAIDALPVDTGGTEFQRTVWRALRRIPVGSTVSYGALARSLGRPTAFRAVAAANGQNPISIVIPCHRVIAADGKLHGYGGGLPRKAWLLDHECMLMRRNHRPMPG